MLHFTTLWEFEIPIQLIFKSILWFIRRAEMPTNTLCLWGTMRQIIFIYDCDATAWSLNFNMSSVHFGRFNKLLQYFKLLKLLKLFCCSSCKHSFQKNLLPPATVQFVIDPDIFLWLICCRTVLKQWHETNARNKPTNKCARKKYFLFWRYFA